MRNIWGRGRPKSQMPAINMLHQLIACLCRSGNQQRRSSNFIFETQSASNYTALILYPSNKQKERGNNYCPRNTKAVKLAECSVAKMAEHSLHAHFLLKFKLHTFDDSDPKTCSVKLARASIFKKQSGRRAIPPPQTWVLLLNSIP